MAIFNQSATPKRDTMPPSAPESALNKQPDPNEISFGSMSTPAPAPAPAPALGHSLPARRRTRRRCSRLL